MGALLGHAFEFFKLHCVGPIEDRCTAAYAVQLHSCSSEAEQQL